MKNKDCAELIYKASTTSMFNLKKNHLICVFLMTTLLIGCKKQPIEYEYKQTIIVTKDKILDDGSDKFVWAFKGGDTRSCTYGEFNKYQVGDTICWQRETGWV